MVSKIMKNNCPLIIYNQQLLNQLKKWVALKVQKLIFKNILGRFKTLHKSTVQDQKARKISSLNPGNREIFRKI